MYLRDVTQGEYRHGGARLLLSGAGCLACCGLGFTPTFLVLVLWKAMKSTINIIFRDSSVEITFGKARALAWGTSGLLHSAIHTTSTEWSHYGETTGRIKVR